MNANDVDRSERVEQVADAMRITKVTHAGSRRRIDLMDVDGERAVWVDGRIDTHTFQALVFPQHAECAEYELADSRISKLYVRRIADRATTANFDRGWDIRPTDEATTDLVDLLAAVLAESVYGF